MEKDVPRRLSASQVLLHPWMQAPLSGTSDTPRTHGMAMHRKAAMRKFRKAVRGVIAVQRFAPARQWGDEAEPDTDEPQAEPAAQILPATVAPPIAVSVPG